MGLLLPLWNTGGEQSGAGGGDGGQGGGQGGGTPWAAPEGFPKDFIGATAEESYGKLAAGYTDLNTRFGGMRDKLATLPAPPKTHDDYTFQPDDKMKPYFGDLGKDPVFGTFKQSAHKNGLSQGQFDGVLKDVYGMMTEKGMLAEPFNPMKEIETFEKSMGYDRQKTTEAFTANETFAKGILGQLKGVPDAIKPQVEAALASLTDTAAGNVFLGALASRLSESGIRIAGDAAGGAMTKADLDKLGGDPRIDPVNRDSQDPAKKFDPDLRKKYDDAYKLLHA